MVTRKTKKLVYNTIVIALLVIGIGYVCSRFLHLGSVEFTDNAQVKQHITPVNTRVQGFIKKIYFEEYQPIHKGDTLLWHKPKRIWQTHWQDKKPPMRG